MRLCCTDHANFYEYGLQNNMFLNTVKYILKHIFTFETLVFQPQHTECTK